MVQFNVRQSKPEKTVVLRMSAPPNQHRKEAPARLWPDAEIVMPFSALRLPVLYSQCRRYIARVIVISMLLSGSVQADECPDFVAPNDKTIEIETEDTMTYIALPSALEGDELKYLSLWVYPSFEGKNEELSVPLFFRVEDGVAKSFFQASSIWGEFEVHAKYGDEICGPRLNHRFAL